MAFAILRMATTPDATCSERQVPRSSYGVGIPLAGVVLWIHECHKIEVVGEAGMLLGEVDRYERRFDPGSGSNRGSAWGE